MSNEPGAYIVGFFTMNTQQELTDMRPLQGCMTLDQAAHELNVDPTVLVKILDALSYHTHKKTLKKHHRQQLVGIKKKTTHKS